MNKFHIATALLIMLILLTLIFNQICFSEETSKSYPDLLNKAVGKAWKSKIGKYQLLGRGSIGGWNHWGFSGSPEHIRFVEGLDEKEAVPFLLGVIQNGPGWPKKNSKGDINLRPHIARCYAVLCLASTKDAQAYPVLVNLLKASAK